VFRSPIAVAVWYIWLVFAMLNLADLAWQGGGHAGVIAASVILLVTGVAYVAALRPRVIADDEAVTVRNPLRDTRVPWPAVTSIDLGDALQVRWKTDRVVHSWAVQSSRRSRVRAQYRAHYRETQAARRTPGYGRMPEAARSRLVKTAGEIITIQINDLLEEARRRSAAADPPLTGGAPSSTWSWTAVAALALPVVLVVLAIVI